MWDRFTLYKYIDGPYINLKHQLHIIALDWFSDSDIGPCLGNGG